MLEITNIIIKFLNARKKYELEDLGVVDRIETILQVKKVLTKKTLNVQLKEKCQVLKLKIDRFFNRMQHLHQKGLPSLFVINEKLMDIGDYVQKLQGIATDAANMSNIKGNITRKSLLEAINNQIHIQHHLKHVFLVKSSFSKYTDDDEVYRRLIKIKIPKQEAWSDLCDYQEE